MNMTNAQRLTLKAFIQGDSTLNGHFTAGRYDELSQALNAAAAGPYVVWRSSVSVDDIFSRATLASYTPSDAIPTGTAGDLTTPMLYGNRAFLCQLKQANLLMMLSQRSGVLVSAKTNVRQALNDAMTNIPAGASGALLDAGWAGATGVRQGALQRNASVAEKALASGTGTTGTPADLGIVDPIGGSYAEGTIQPGDIGTIMA